MFLLPREYREILTRDTELRKYAENLDEFAKSLICTSILNDHGKQHLNSEDRPSSSHRNSSILPSTESNDLVVADNENIKNVANRPPLPKGILRHPVVQNIKSRKNLLNTKRYFRNILFL